MHIIPPRLSRLLIILTESKAPVSVSELADVCGVSRRTIFREIENIDPLLKPYGLTIGSKVGEGILLEGEPAGKESLRAMLHQKCAAQPHPACRYERRLLLALDLLTCYEPQKLFYYADNFKVSEATISHDLDILESRLGNFGLALTRKPGLGVCVKGIEAAFRSAICDTVTQIRVNDARLLEALDYPSKAIHNGMRQLMKDRFSHQILWMTEESKDALYLYMMVTVERVKGRFAIESCSEEAPSPYLPMADYFSNSLELKFAIVISEWERRNLAIVLSGLRQAGNSPNDCDGASNDYYLKLLAYRMIEHFDAELAPFLKLDDRLVDGLARHMQSALVRIKNRVTLCDPLLEEIVRVYPDIFEKCKRALSALDEISGEIPDSEASFLTTHFGAGVMRIRGATARRRFRIGVVCQSGIGTSYLLSMQINKHFGFRAETEICALEDIENWRRFDLCVTTIPLYDIPIPTLQVKTLLDEDDVAAIEKQLETLPVFERRAHTEHNAAATRRLPGFCRESAAALGNVAEILTYFDMLTIEKDCDFDHLARLTGYRFAGQPEDGRMIYEDIVRRESLSTQVVPELELILLHARTGGVKGPLFSLILPEGGRFTAPALQGSRCCVVMLAPLEASRDMLNIMGRISSALLEDEAFLNAVRNGDKAGVYHRLEDNLRDYLMSTIIF